MPELPEVETTVRGMNETVKGLTITGFWCDWEKLIHDISPDKLKKNILGADFTTIERRGKNIFAHLSNGYTLIMHMKMTGHFMYGKYSYIKKENKWIPDDPLSPLADPYNRFVHVVFSLSNGYRLVFCDARKFGSIELVHTEKVQDHKRISTLGPEPLDKEFTYDAFLERLSKKRNSKIKQVLLDQSIVAGIGNIYADESLHKAGIRPERPISSLTNQDLKKLHSGIIASLRSGLYLGGDSTSDYRNIRGERGTSQHTHAVYRQTGESCRKKGCAGIIQRIVVAGRGTHFCPKCQI